MDNRSLRVPLLAYHRVHRDDDPQMPPVVDGEYCGHVTLSVFRKQMSTLAEKGFHVVTHREIAQWLLGGKQMPSDRVAAVDFHDNRLNVFENAFPVMEEHGFKGTVFTVSALADGQLPEMAAEFPVMNWDHLRILVDSGWTIGAHTHTHAELAKLHQACGPSAVEEELARCRELIEQRLGTRPDSFTYPAGDWNEAVEEIVKRHYRTAIHWYLRPEYNTIETNPYRLKCVNISMSGREDYFEEVLAGAV